MTTGMFLNKKKTPGSLNIQCLPEGLDGDTSTILNTNFFPSLTLNSQILGFLTPYTKKFTVTLNFIQM